MKGYVISFENKKVEVKECEIENVLIDEEYLKSMNGKDNIVVKIGNKKGLVRVEHVYIDLKKVRRKCVEYSIKQKIKNSGVNECYWCGKRLYSYKECTVDHIIPKCKSKSWKEAWAESNLVVSCYECNQNKTNLHPNLNLHIQRKAELLKYKSCKLSRKNRKICNIFSSKNNNVEYIVRRDSSFYNKKAFFLKRKYVELA